MSLLPNLINNTLTVVGNSLQFLGSGLNIVGANIISSSTVPSSGLVMTTNSNGTATWQSPSSTVPRVFSEVSNGSPAPNCNLYDIHEETALATAPLVGAPTGSPSEGQWFQFIIKDNGTAQALSWNAIYVASSVPLPSTTTAGAVLSISFQYNSALTKWICKGVA